MYFMTERQKQKTKTEYLDLDSEDEGNVDAFGLKKCTSSRLSRN